MNDNPNKPENELDGAKKDESKRTDNPSNEPTMTKRPLDPQVKAALVAAAGSLLVAIIVGIFALVTRPSDVVNEAKNETDKLMKRIEILRDTEQFPFVPAGTIISYGGNPNTDLLKSQGWLFCDGESFSPEEDNKKYARLFNAIGFSWGRDKVDTNKFCVPDLQGLFLRGLDPEGKNDPDFKVRTNSLGQIGPLVGSFQQDQIIKHHHSYEQAKKGTLADNAHQGQPYGGNEPKQTSDFGGNETRPKNVYVYYLIKY